MAAEGRHNLLNPLTPQEEQEAWQELHGEALALGQRLLETRTALTHEELQLFEDLGRLIAQGDFSEGLEILAFAHEEALGHGHWSGELLEMADDLMEVLEAGSPLETVYPLPTALGQMTPGAFLQRAQESPRELRDLLLAPLDEDQNPEDNLLLVLRNLRDDLLHWQDAPSLRPSPESASRRVFRDDLWNACQRWANGPGSPGGSLRRRARECYLQLLRERLRRCESPLEIPDTWLFPRWSWDSLSSVDRALELLVATQSALNTPGGAPLSMDTWDALVACVFSLLGRLADGAIKLQIAEASPHEEGPARRERQAQALAQALLTLEREEITELPPGLRKAFLEKALQECAEVTWGGVAMEAS